MKNTLNYHAMVQQLRRFFHDTKHFIEIPTQSRFSTLATGERPDTITEFFVNQFRYPLPQTAQLSLEYELLNNPEWPGVFCITTTYHQEPMITGNHLEQLFPLFEFEMRGTYGQAQAVQKELLIFLGFDAVADFTYEMACAQLGTQHLDALYEQRLCTESASAVIVEKFPARTEPFWNIKYAGDGLFYKTKTIIQGLSCFTGAQRETDTGHMREQFLALCNGKYAQTLFNHFGKERVLAELEEFFCLPQESHFGGALELKNLEIAMDLCARFDVCPALIAPSKIVPAHITS